jgi:hypothetical protein
VSANERVVISGVVKVVPDRSLSNGFQDVSVGHLVHSRCCPVRPNGGVGRKVSELCHQAGQGLAWAQGFIPGLGVGHLGIFGSIFLVGEVNGDSVCLLESFDQ